jgi:hypothetical protein
LEKTMTARDTYAASVKSAAATKIATLTANETAKQESINGSGCNVGYNTINGNYTNFNNAMQAAIVAKRNADYAAEVVRQAAADAAREALRAVADYGPL